MKFILINLLLCSLYLASSSQTTQGDILSQEKCKAITEYYCKQYIIDEVLKVPDRQQVEVYISPITAAKSGELTTVLYHCNALNKKGVVFAFWNDYYTTSILPYKGLGFSNLDLEQAKKLFSNLESLMDQDNKILSNAEGNLAYKVDELTFLFCNSELMVGNKPIRVWYKTFDSDWNQTNLRTTIKRFRKFFNISK
jgi:hypothetical protein